MHDNFYYMVCPLCQRNVDPSQPDYYRVLSLDSEKMTVSKSQSILDTIISKLTTSQLTRGYAFLILNTCERLCVYTRGASHSLTICHSQSYIFFWIWLSLLFSAGEMSQSRYGNFYAQPFQEQDSIPAPTVTPLESRQRVSGKPCVSSYTVLSREKKKKQSDSPSSPLSPSLIASLPPEIWSMIL